MNSFNVGQIVLVKIDFDDAIWVLITSEIVNGSFSGVFFPPISEQQSVLFRNDQVIMVFSDIP
ncbi:hypothetical protein [uncultured Enterococcus sp.]|uniref:hypothetical protein n=1 Tax=uncultured Enterococcus sp. TaxID=167972 RepID=UPI002AA82DF5|nr:hypothetical protein [uncultured Enterococcus sp.]